MVIVIINSSPRSNGATAKILTEIRDRLQKQSDMEVRMVHLAKQKLEFCKGCCRCYQTGTCFIQDDAEEISGLIARADGLIVGSPTYASSMTGQMKTLVDRGHFVMEQLLRGKHTMSVVTYENADGVSVTKAFNKLFLYSGAILNGSLCFKVPFGGNPLANQAVRKKIHGKTDRFLYQLKIGAKGRISDRILHRLVFHIGIKPFILRKPENYAGVLKHWKERGIDYGAV